MEWIRFAIMLLAVFGCLYFACKAFDLHADYQRAVVRIERLSNAIRKHRDQNGDDRCWLDDEELYNILPEGYTPPERDSAVELKNCIDFIACRRNPRTIYVSPQREIERLKSVVADLAETSSKQQRAIREFERMREDGKNGDYWIWQSNGGNHLESLTCPVLIAAAELRRLLSEEERQKSQSSG